MTTLLIGAATAFSGDTTTSTDTKNIVEIQPDAHPLSFLDGKVVFDVQERMRGEIRENNYDFNSAVHSLTDGAWVEQRFRIGVAAKPVDWLKFYVQGQDSREMGSDRPKNPGVLGAEGDDTFDLRQGYVEIADCKKFPLGLTVGRQVLSYGDERLVGASDWNNIGRTFDAVKLRLQLDKCSLDAFASTVVVPARGRFNQSDFFNGTETERGQVFYGLYFTDNHLSFQTTDLYVLALHQTNPATTTGTAITPSSKTDFATLGMRVKGDPTKLCGFEYDAELAGQAGTLHGKDLLAGAAHAGLGYNWFDVWGKPRVYAEYNYASGDDHSDPNTVGTFQNLFPTNHKFYGYMDLFSWQNMSEPAVWFRINPVAPVAFELSYHAYWLATTNDAWYRANGVTTVRPITPGASSFAGTEIDAKATWTVCKNLGLEAGYSHFFAGTYLKDTGAHDDADFGYVMATVNF